MGPSHQENCSLESIELIVFFYNLCMQERNIWISKKVVLQYRRLGGYTFPTLLRTWDEQFLQYLIVIIIITIIIIIIIVNSINIHFSIPSLMQNWANEDLSLHFLFGSSFSSIIRYDHITIGNNNNAFLIFEININRDRNVLFKNELWYNYINFNYLQWMIWNKQFISVVFIIIVIESKSYLP